MVRTPGHQYIVTGQEVFSVHFLIACVQPPLPSKKSIFFRGGAAVHRLLPEILRLLNLFTGLSGNQGKTHLIKVLLRRVDFSRSLFLQVCSNTVIVS